MYIYLQIPSSNFVIHKCRLTNIHVYIYYLILLAFITGNSSYWKQ